ncbi:ester cyclase [Pseudocolwellia agarivorans]|uniref:ester cyclase n=1 Tax=Pseudocolwellia agarivorans TaxID=1911682 RepID=UPI000986B6FA|nr:ester cyclase [Pseudocolwellia agarivorans]
MTTLLDKLYLQLKSSADNIEAYVADDVQWNVSAPINELHNKAQMLSQFWQPLITALPDIERKPFIHIESEYQGAQWIAGTGYFVGTFAKDLLDIPATNRTLYLRYTELVKLEEGKVKECFIILDFLDAMNQAGVNPLRKSLGHDGLIMPPSTMDGLCYGDTAKADESESQKSQQLVIDMLDELGRFDGKSLASMQLQNFWHSDFMWYGPAGIGTTRGIEGFRANHQGPFVFSFPDRSVDHKATLVAHNNYVSTGGWPHMHGTHSVGGWLGLPPTNKELSLRVMDIWRREGELLKENWVAIDIIDMCMQMGIDVFAMMREQKQGKAC